MEVFFFSFALEITLERFRNRNVRLSVGSHDHRMCEMYNSLLFCESIGISIYEYSESILLCMYN